MTLATAPRFSLVSVRQLFVIGLVASGLFVMALPTFAHAATYAYVDASMEIKAITANDWQTALATAPNIHIHSGVVLLVSQLSGMVGSSI